MIDRTANGLAASDPATGPSEIEIATRRLAAALDALESAVERRRETDRGEDELAARIQALGHDRSRLANELDGSLVRNINASSVHQVVVTAVNDLARDLGLRVVAECIETPQELETLRALGIELLQGYLFAKPAPPFITVDFTRF